MQKWVENFAKEWVEYLFLAMAANANAIAISQCERTLTTLLSYTDEETSGLVQLSASPSWTVSGTLFIFYRPSVMWRR